MFIVYVVMKVPIFSLNEGLMNIRVELSCGSRGLPQIHAPPRLYPCLTVWSSNHSTGPILRPTATARCYSSTGPAGPIQLLSPGLVSARQYTLRWLAV